MVELALGVALGTLVILAAWGLFVSARKEQMTNQRMASAGTELQAVQEALTRDLYEAGLDMFSAWNLSAVNVKTGGTAEEPTDTLLVLRAESAGFRASSYGCGSGAGECVAVVGDVSAEIHEGDILVVGSERTGARIVEVSDVSAAYSEGCGSDCQEALNCGDQVVGSVNALVSMGSTLYTQAGDTIVSGAACTAPYLSDGSRCENSLVIQSVGSAVAQVCSVAASPVTSYTDISYVDRTTTFGYPAFGGFTSRSGARGIPAVWVQKVSFRRYYVRAEVGGSTTLVAEMGMSNGVFTTAVPVASSIEKFRAQIAHENAGGPGAFERGMTITADSLAFDAANTNFTRNLTSVSSGAVPGFTFARSYRTISAVRLTYDVVRLGVDGAPVTQSVETLVAAPQLLGGGQIRTR